MFAFLLALLITEIYSYLIWFEIVAPPAHRGGNVLVNNPIPFMTHVSYNPILAFAIYLVAHKVFINQALSKTKLYLYSFFSTNYDY